MNVHRALLSLLCTAALAAQATSPAPAPSAPPVLAGIDVLAANGCRELQGRVCGLVTNHTGRTRDGRRTVDVLRAADGVQLRVLFSPEHGWDGALDERTTDTTDAASGLPVHSLYGDTRAPTAAMLQGLDTLVFDIQDAGCRFYTYVSTMRLALEAAGAHGLRFVVLDRPNPIDGVHIDGPLLTKERIDFVGTHTLPLRHGMTTGELARLFQGELGIQVDLQVIACTGWQRAMTYDATGLPWIAPSPNLRRLSQALLYPGIGLLEATNLSVGRGTDTPFEIVGAPWCDGVRLADELRRLQLPGVAFVPVRFTPTASKFHGEPCGGVHVLTTDWQTLAPVRTGIAIACALHRLYPAAWDTKNLDALLKHPASCERILRGDDDAAIAAAWKQDIELFRRRRKPFLLYD